MAHRSMLARPHAPAFRCRSTPGACAVIITARIWQQPREISSPGSGDQGATASRSEAGKHRSKENKGKSNETIKETEKPGLLRDDDCFSVVVRMGRRTGEEERCRSPRTDDLGG